MVDKPESGKQTIEAQETSGQSAEAEGALKPKGISIIDHMKAKSPITYSVVSVLTLFVLVWQGCINQRQTEILRQNAASMYTTIELSRNDQRAWISTEVEATYGENLPLSGSVILTNSGRTPARNVRLRSQLRFESDESRFEFRPSDSQLPVSNSVGNIGPGAYIHGPFTTSPRLLTTTEIDDIPKRNLVVYIFGRVDYDDVFDEPRYQRFFQRLHPPTSEWEFLDTYNDGN